MASTEEASVVNRKGGPNSEEENAVDEDILPENNTHNSLIKLKLSSIYNYRQMGALL